MLIEKQTKMIYCHLNRKGLSKIFSAKTPKTMLWGVNPVVCIRIHIHM